MFRSSRIGSGAPFGLTMQSRAARPLSQVVTWVNPRFSSIRPSSLSMNGSSSSTRILIVDLSTMVCFPCCFGALAKSRLQRIEILLDRGHFSLETRQRHGQRFDLAGLARLLHFGA